MTHNQMDVELVKRICRRADGPDGEAMDFLANHWAPYCHAIDDIIDGELTEPEEILAVFARAIVIYSHSFYLKNIGALRQVALNVTSMFADTVAWEKREGWQGQWSDAHRHCSLEMVAATAMICGGYPHARTMMLELRAMAYNEHHDLEGTPV